MLLLILSILVLMSAPTLYFLAMRFTHIWKALEKLIFITVAILVTLHILPESVEVAGWKASCIAFIGMFLPSLLERMWHHSLHKIHFVAVLITILGVGIHNLLDGAALASPELSAEASVSMLPYAVVLHRIPEGLLIVGLLYPRRSLRWVMFFLGVCCLFTVLGYFLGEALLQDSTTVLGFAYFQALMAGSLLHVLLDQHEH